MSTDKTRENRTERKDDKTPARKAWTRPEFTDQAACAEICAYVLRG